jgi:hypothetical protein
MQPEINLPAIGHNLSQKRMDKVACNRVCLGHGTYQETT